MHRADAPTVVIADYDYGDVDIERAIVEGAGLQLVAAQCKTEDDVIDVASDADAIIAQYATVGEKAIAALTRCQVIARYGTGVDIVDVDAATRRGILVTNVPNDWCENEVADHAMALLLTLARKIRAYDEATRAGTWRWQTGAPIHRLRGSVLGLLSFGAIARAIAARAAGFGMRVIAHDPYVPERDVAAAGATSVAFGELLEQSDYLVVQAPLTAGTHHLIDESALRRMKPTAFLINTARGPIVSDDALYRGLQEGWIAGAGLDDIEEEPAKQRDWKPTNPLFTLPNAVVTPHAAYYSEEAIHTVRDFAAHEVVRVLTPAATAFTGERRPARRQSSVTVARDAGPIVHSVGATVAGCAAASATDGSVNARSAKAAVVRVASKVMSAVSIVSAARGARATGAISLSNARGTCRMGRFVPRTSFSRAASSLNVRFLGPPISTTRPR
jgi:D-3-phosphoglycerate dehydrogenase